MKRRETDPASSQFLICAAQSGPLTDVHGVIQRRGRKETEVARRIKVGNQKERDRSSQ